MASAYRPDSATVTAPSPRGAAVLRYARSQNRSIVPVYMAATLMYLLFVPEQFHFRISGIYFPTYRLFMLPATLYLLSSAVGGRFRFSWPDLLVILSTTWIWLASYMTSGSVTTSIVQGGAHTLDIAFAYLLARVAIQSPRELRFFLTLIAPGLALISLLVTLEALTHVRLLQELASDITGVPNRLRNEVRMGLMRGAGPFPHPILAGIFLASFLPLYLMSGLRGWPKAVGALASFGGFFSMSSAALLGLLMGGLLRAYDWLVERIANVTWWLFISATSIIYMVLEFGTNAGFFGLLVRFASFNTVSAYNRVLIWNFGTENIAKSPWFGIGYADWDRPDWMHWDSFDHFWLILALRFGIASSVFLILATVAGVALVATKSRKLKPVDARLLRGVAISLAVFALGAVSVSLWLSVLVWFSMLLGIAISLARHCDEQHGMPMGSRRGNGRRMAPHHLTRSVQPSNIR